VSGEDGFMPVLTPDCPLCGQPPFMMLGGGTQAFCGNDDCKTLTWNPAKSVDEFLLDVSFIELPERS